MIDVVHEICFVFLIQVGITNSHDLGASVCQFIITHLVRGFIHKVRESSVLCVTPMNTPSPQQKYEFSKLFAKLSTQRISMYLGVLFFHGFLHGFLLPVLPTTRWFFFFPENHVMDFSSNAKMQNFGDLPGSKAHHLRPKKHQKADGFPTCVTDFHRFPRFSQTIATVVQIHNATIIIL